MFLVLCEVARAASLTLLVEGLATDRGVVICSLFASGGDWLGASPFPRATAIPSGGRADCVFADVPDGRYAVTFLQDLNGNGSMDKGFLGLPLEPWGVSRDAPARFGPPAFADAAFDVPAPVAPVAHPK